MTIENSSIQYAFRIVTDYTTDVPDVGLFNGEIRFITGRETTGFTFENGDTADGFLTGYLIKEPLKNVGRKIDISTGGNFNSLNSCTVTIDNTTKYIQNLLSNGIFLINSEIHIYCVIDNVMYDVFGGVLNDIRYNEKNVVFECKDLNELVFKQVPENNKTQTTIGDIAYTKLKKEPQGDIINIASAFADSYYEETYEGNRVPYINMVVSPDFVDNLDSTGIDCMKGLFLRPRKGGIVSSSDSFEDAVEIIGSGSVTIFNKNIGIETIKEYHILCYLKLPFNGVLSQNMVNSLDFFEPSTDNEAPFLLNFNEPDEKVMFDIIEFKTRYYIASDDIESIELDSDGKPIVYTYDTENDRYILIDAAIDYDLEASNPYIILKNNTEEIKTLNHKRIKFSECQFKFNDDVQGVLDGNDEPLFTIWDDNRPWENGELLIDGKYNTMPNPSGSERILPFRSTYTVNNGNIRANNGVTIVATLPNDFNWNDYENWYIGCGAEWYMGSVTLLPDDLEFVFQTHTPAYFRYEKDGVQLSKRKFISQASNKPSMLMREDGSFTQLYNDGRRPPIQDPINDARIVFTPFNDNLDTARTPKQVFSDYYKLGEYNNNGRDTNYIEIDQKLKENMKLENNPVWLDYEDTYIDDKDEIKPKKKVCLFPIINPFDNDGDYWSMNFWLYDIHLIGEQVISSQELYVKVKGELVTVGGESVPSNNVADTFRLLLEQKNTFTDVNYTNVIDYRTRWDCSRIISTPTSSKDLVKNLAQQSFVGVYTNRVGHIELSAFREDNTYKNEWVHDNTTIVNASIKNVTTTNVSKVYNDINLEYNKNYATDKFTLPYSVTNVDNPPFPGASELFYSSVTVPINVPISSWGADNTNPELANTISVSSRTIENYDYVQYLKELKVGNEITFRNDNDNSFYRYEIVNIDGYADLVDETKAFFDVVLIDSGATPLIDGEQTTFEYTPFPYEDFSDIPSYSDARIFWENGHETWLRNRVVNNLTPDLSKCEWYRDLREFNSDANGVMASSIHYYMENLVEWVTKPKNRIKYSIPLNETNVAIELLDRVSFSDVLITDNNYIDAWVTSVSIDEKKRVIDLEITTEPVDLIPIYPIIDEKSNFTDTIDEGPDSLDNVEEEFELF